MAMKIFTNAFTGNLTESIAINPAHVVSVFEIPWVDEETQEETKATSIFGVRADRQRQGRRFPDQSGTECPID